jgi:hypothetical protein
MKQRMPYIHQRVLTFLIISHDSQRRIATLNNYCASKISEEIDEVRLATIIRLRKAGSGQFACRSLIQNLGTTPDRAKNRDITFHCKRLLPDSASIASFLHF